MPKRKRSCPVLLSVAVVFCAFFFFSTAVSAEESRVDFNRQAEERSRIYLSSIQNRVADLPAEQRERIERQARYAVAKGFARLSRPADLVRKKSLASIDPETLSDFFREIGGFQKHSSVAGFLALNFHRPTELEIVVRAAVPSRYHWEKRFGILADHRPGSGPGLDLSTWVSLGCCEMIVGPFPSRTGKTLAMLLGQNILSVSSDRQDDDYIRLLTDDNLLSGFPLIAQTVVLRI